MDGRDSSAAPRNDMGGVGDDGGGGRAGVGDGGGGGMAMNVRFYIDPEKGYPHIYSHGVVEGEVEDVLLLPGEDRPGRGGARIATGMTAAGRCLRVI